MAEDSFISTQGFQSDGKPPEPSTGPPLDDDTGTIGSTDWFASSFGLVLCGKRMSNEKVKQVVYGGGAVLVLLIVVLIMNIALGGGGDSSSAQGPPPTGGMRTIYYEYCTWGESCTGHPNAPSQPLSVEMGHECSIFRNDATTFSATLPSTPTPTCDDAGAATPPQAEDEARCVLTANGELYAWHRDPTAWCASDDGGEHPEDCGFAMGDLTRHGCSRVEWGGMEGHFLECCFAFADDSNPPASCTVVPPVVTSADCNHPGSGLSPSTLCEGPLCNDANVCQRLPFSSLNVELIPDCSASNVDAGCHIFVAYTNFTTHPWTELTEFGTQITDWEGNGDDGWYHITLDFNFHWFGELEQVITVGTNGLLTFGTGHLAYGGSEPVPCTSGDSCDGGHVIEMDGVIAPFWCDLNPDTAGDHEGVYYLQEASQEASKFTVQWSVDTFDTGNPQHVNLQAILLDDGTVEFLYRDMPLGDSGSWSAESIGFEDHTGAKGVQISFDTVPAAGTTYTIDSSCHVAVYDGSATCDARCANHFAGISNLECSCGWGCAQGGQPGHGSELALFQWCQSQCHTHSGTCDTDGVFDEDACNEGCFIAAYQI